MGKPTAKEHKAKSEAVSRYKQAIQANPNNAEAHNNLGIAYGELRRYTEAIAAYKQAIRIKPDYARAHYNLGVAYLSEYNTYLRLRNIGVSSRLLQDAADYRDLALEEYKILKDLDKELANRLFNRIYK